MFQLNVGSIRPPEGKLNKPKTTTRTVDAEKAMPEAPSAVSSSFESEVFVDPPGVGVGVGVGLGVGTGDGVGGASPAAIAAAARVLTFFDSIFTSGAFVMSGTPTAETAFVNSPVWNTVLSWPAAAPEDTWEAPLVLISRRSLEADAVDILRPPPC